MSSYHQLGNTNSAINSHDSVIYFFEWVFVLSCIKGANIDPVKPIQFYVLESYVRILRMFKYT